MPITQSTIRIYADQLKTDLVHEQTTSGSATSILIADVLDAGTEYWCTVQAVDGQGLTTEESSVYRFYTLPDVTWFAGPYASVNSISAQLEGITDDVTITRYGIVYATQSDFSDAVYYDQVQGGIDIYGLEESTRYYVRPYVIDEFDRRWVNIDAETYVDTTATVPVVNWTGMSAIEATKYRSQINITSSSTLTSVVAVLTPSGGSPQTITLSPTVGVQGVVITGLTPNTSYSVVVNATNSGGTGHSTTRTFTTMSAAGSAQVELTSVSVSNSNNIISVDSRATYDSSIVTITGHYIELYSNDTHTGTAEESNSGGAVANYSNNLSHANPDETYYVFSRVTYTVQGDNNVYTAWSEPYEVTTYALLSFGNITTTQTTASVPYSVAGSATSVELEYSLDGVSWIAIPASSLSGGTVTISNLTQDTQYQLRGRCKSESGWQDYDTTSFRTTSFTTTVTIVSITNIYENGADVNLNIQD